VEARHGVSNTAFFSRIVLLSKTWRNLVIAFAARVCSPQNTSARERAWEREGGGGGGEGGGERDAESDTHRYLVTTPLCSQAHTRTHDDLRTRDASQSRVRAVDTADLRKG